MNKILLTILTLILTVTLGVRVSNAIGSLTPSGTAGDDTQYSLNDIYDKLTNFADNPTATSSPFTTPGSVSASFRTLSEIYDLLTAENTDLVAGKIATGTNIFGVVGTLPLTPQLEWSSAQNGGLDTDWDSAVAICANLSPTGQWRLPSISELLAGISDEWILENVTPGTGFSYFINYWSDTEYDSESVWISGWDSNIYYYTVSKPMSAQVRCVR